MTDDYEEESPMTTMRIPSSRGRAGNTVEVVLPANLATIAAPMATEADKLQGFEDLKRSTSDELTALASELQRAEHERGEGVADAVLAGKPMPTKDPTKPIRDAIERAQCHLAGIETAIVRQTASTVAALEENRAELVSAALEARAPAAERMRAATAELADARSDLIARIEDVAWLEGFPHSKTSWDTSQGAMLLEASVPNGLLPWDSLVVALEKDASPERRGVPERVPGLQAPRRVREGFGYGKPSSQMTPEERIASDRYENGEIEFKDLPASIRQQSTFVRGTFR